MLATSIKNQWCYGEVNNFLVSYYGLLTLDMMTFSGWGHFSQVVWKGSTTVGCASQYCAANTIFPGLREIILESSVPMLRGHWDSLPFMSWYSSDEEGVFDF
ncbi:hypothetical protein BDZ45DRAFT_750888 [Acephala macrosclerotiorum]|nr:hypothetical protein BDZ45DRAFT_750888 [Acephala macrosclerotiorum]